MSKLPLNSLEAKLTALAPFPKDQGRLSLIVARPESGKRKLPDQAQLSPEHGLEGDRWTLEADPERLAQLSLTNVQVMRALAGEEAKLPLCGNNLLVDFDLSEANLPVGQRLKIGETLLEVSPKPHRGCGKLAQYFGPEAVKAINHPERKGLRLRGLFVRVIAGGTIRKGDLIEKMTG